MERLLEFVLRRFVRRGILRYTTAKGSVFTVGDGTGTPVAVRFLTKSAEYELMLTDILHAFSMNPTNPAYDPKWEPPLAQSDNEWAELPQGIHHIGHHGDSFCFDNEMPRHQTLLRQGLIACGLVTNGEWLEFMGPSRRFLELPSWSG